MGRFLAGNAIFVACLILPSLAGRSDAFRIDELHTASRHRPAVAPTVPIVPNHDRLDCVRQDNLDLVKPLTEANALRVIIPTDKENSAKDVFLSMDQLWIKHAALTIELKSTDRKSFTFTIGGSHSVDGYDNVGVIDFRLYGTDFLLHPSIVDTLANWVVSRDDLRKGQDGKVLFKMTGEGRSVFNNETGNWEMKLVRKDANPFVLDIANAWFLQHILNKIEGVNKAIRDNVLDLIWTSVEKLIPPTFGASMTYLTSDELNFDCYATVTGGQASVDEPLKLKGQTDLKVSMRPSRVLEEFVTHFDPVAQAQYRMKVLIENFHLIELWEKNKPEVEATLKRYGISTDIIDGGNLDPDELRQRLVFAAKKGADSLVKSLKPFIDAYKSGKDHIFEGVVVALAFTLALQEGENLGSAVIKAPTQEGKRKAVFLPSTFLKAIVDPGGQLVTDRKTGVSNTAFTNLSFAGSALGCERVQLRNIRISPGNATNKTFKITGAARDMSLKIPSRFAPGIQFAWPTANGSLSDEGITVDIGETGLKVQRVPYTPNPLDPVALAPRMGSEDALDGALPVELSRSTVVAETFPLVTMAPEIDSGLTFGIDGEGADVHVRLHGDVDVSLRIHETVRPLLAPRPKEDFGYVFFAGRFRRDVKDAESGALSGDIVAVVSCGYLRLYKYDKVFNDPDDVFSPVDFEPKNGQLELDLTLYTETPTSSAKGEDECVRLYSSGYVGRKVGGGLFGHTTYPEELICGPPADVKKLHAAIDIQVKRFNSDPAKSQEWRFGTHETQTGDGIDKPQYLLPEGLVTADLRDLIKEAHNPSL